MIEKICKEIEKILEKIIGPGYKENSHLLYVVSVDGSEKDFFFLFEKPGKINGNEMKELEKSRGDYKKFVETCQKFFNAWAQENKTMTKVKNVYGLLGQGDYALTDANKLSFSQIEKHYPGKIKPHDKEIEKIMQKILIEEIRTVNPSIIFAMGNTAKDYLLKIMKFGDEHTKKLGKGGKDITGICELHGDLLTADFDGKNIFVMPLLHPSSRTNCPKDAYTHYMKKGIKEFEETPEGIKLVDAGKITKL